MQHQDFWNFNMSLEEVEDGFKVYIRGDKEVLRPRLEAMEAWLNYRQKAQAAGWNTGCKPWHGHGHGFHGMYGQGHHKLKRFMKDVHRAFAEAVTDKKEGGHDERNGNEK